MDNPWEPCDVPLTLERITRLVRGQAAELDSFHFLDEGWDSWVCTARDSYGREWILRFPKRGEVVDQRDREIALLPVLAPRLPLAVPRFSLLGQTGEGYPHRFVGYPRLPRYGVTAGREAHTRARRARWEPSGKCTRMGTCHPSNAMCLPQRTVRRSFRAS